MCIYNTYVINPRYKKNQKNGGDVPPLPDNRILYIPVGCGKCMECRKQERLKWQSRLLEDIKTNRNGKFITLTFSNESIAKLIEEYKIEKIPMLTDKKGKVIQYAQTKIQRIADLKGYERDNAIATKAVHYFRERWRKKFGTSPRHWLITELGHNGTENIHLHGIIWTNQSIDDIRERWQYGYIWPRKENKEPNYVSIRTINYIVKYVSKQDRQHKEYKPKILTSPGIGKNYTESYNATKHIYKPGETIEAYKTSTGHEINMPIYWRNKLWTEQQREKLWIEKLDKLERWVDGVKYDISVTDAPYKKAVQEARIKNKELGYGGIVNDNRKEYEEQRRDIMLQTRLKQYKKE